MTDGPGFIVLSPAGFVMRYEEKAPRNGPGSQGGVVVSPVLKGQTVLVSGKGTVAVSSSGLAGTLDVQVMAGAHNSNRALAYLVDRPAAPTAYLGISLDGSNRPYAVVLDASGSVVAWTAVAGPEVPPGASIHAKLSWDSRSPLYGGSYIYFEVNGQAPNVWVKEAMAPWTPFVPTNVFAGYGPDPDFNGVLGFIQVSNTVTVVPVGTPIPSLEHVSLTANSALVGALGMEYAMQASVQANSAVTAGLTVTPP